jgi:hypothetical protein
MPTCLAPRQSPRLPQQHPVETRAQNSAATRQQGCRVRTLAGRLRAPACGSRRTGDRDHVSGPPMRAQHVVMHLRVHFVERHKVGHVRQEARRLHDVVAVSAGSFENVLDILERATLHMRVSRSTLQPRARSRPGRMLTACALKSPSTSAPVAGSSGSWPLTNTKPLATIACAACARVRPVSTG